MAKAEAKPKPTLEQAMSNIDKTFGDGSIMFLDTTDHYDVEVIPTGIPTLDDALGAGGLPRGRVIEVYGPYSSGKTTLALHVVAEAQRLGLQCAYFDVEYALDPVYARGVGVDTSKLIIAQPGNGNNAFEQIEMLMVTGAVRVIVVDSVAGLVTRAEIEGDYGDSNIGLQARLMSQSMRKLVGSGMTTDNDCMLLFINQLREKPGVIYGSPEVTPGGKALEFWSSVRIDVRRKDLIKEGDQVTGNKVKFKIVKNKVGPPYKTAEADIEYGFGFSREGSLLDLALARGLVVKSGSWFTYEGEQLGQGRENVKARFEDDAQLAEEIKQRLAGDKSDGPSLTGPDTGFIVAGNPAGASGFDD